VPRNAYRCVAVILYLIPMAALMAIVTGSSAAGTTQPAHPQTEPPPTEAHTAYLPLIRHSRWITAPLVNGGFELDWEVEASHRALRFSTDGTVSEIEPPEIRTPPGWVTWFKHGVPVAHDETNPVGWAQPEVSETLAVYPDRMHSGAKGQKLFTFWMIHDAGFLQQVNVNPGECVRLNGWAHAWSHNGGSPDPALYAFWSEGSHVGYNHFFAYEGTEGLDDADRNFTFWLGIDPLGGTDPYADSVVWGQGAHIYNAYQQVPAVTTTAMGPTVTIFLRSFTLWPFNNNDAYWDDIHLEVLSR
jgi:hypothetical protein